VDPSVSQTVNNKDICNVMDFQNTTDLTKTRSKYYPYWTSWKI
jgi:hypothetical protein